MSELHVGADTDGPRRRRARRLQEELEDAAIRLPDDNTLRRALVIDS